MICSACDANRPAGDAFCIECGAALTAVELLDAAPTDGGSREPVSMPIPLDPEAPDAQPTPVQEMVGQERSQWIDSVWGSVKGVRR